MKINMNPMMGEKIWNMDDRFTNRISDRLEELDQATATGNQFLRYRLLRIIFMGTSFKYPEKEEEIKTDLDKIMNTLKTFNTGRTSGAMQHNSVLITDVEAKVDDLTFKIIECLYEVDLICLKKSEKKIEPTTNWK